MNRGPCSATLFVAVLVVLSASRVQAQDPISNEAEALQNYIAAQKNQLTSFTMGLELNWQYCGGSYAQGNTWSQGTDAIVNNDLYKGVTCSKAGSYVTDCNAAVAKLSAATTGNVTCKANITTLANAINAQQPTWSADHQTSVMYQQMLDGMYAYVPHAVYGDYPRIWSEAHAMNGNLANFMTHLQGNGTQLCVGYLPAVADKDALIKNVCEPAAQNALAGQSAFATVLQNLAFAWCFQYNPGNISACGSVIMSNPKAWLDIYK